MHVCRSRFDRAPVRLPCSFRIRSKPSVRDVAGHCNRHRTQPSDLSRMSRFQQSSPILNLKKTSLGRLTTSVTSIFCNLADGKLGVVSPVFPKEFLAQNGLRTELLREVGLPRVGGPCLKTVFRIEGDQDESFVWFGVGVWCCVRDEHRYGRSP